MNPAITLWAAIVPLMMSGTTEQSAARMKEIFSWKRIDFQFENETHRQEMIESGQFVPGNSIATSVALWSDKLFLTTPRFKLGVPASLSYITLNLTDTKANNVTSPLLLAFPNWESHDIQLRNITSVLNIHIDACDRLWALDSGQIEHKYESDPGLVIFDLKSNQQLDSQKLKSKTDYKTEPFLADIVVDVTSSNCDNAYVYIADANNYEIVIYNQRTRDFHKISHNYFHFDPLGGDLSIDDVLYQTQHGVFSLAMSPVGRDDYRVLYFSALASTMQFAVSTRVLQNKTLDSIKSFYEFKVMGSKGANSQSSASSFDEETGVLFYTLIAKHAIACWNSFSGDEFNERTQGIIIEDESLIYPSDVEVDKNGLLWALYNRLPRFQYGVIDPEDISIRILNGAIRNIIKGTVCDAM